MGILAKMMSSNVLKEYKELVVPEEQNVEKEMNSIKKCLDTIPLIPELDIEKAKKYDLEFNVSQGFLWEAVKGMYVKTDHFEYYYEVIPNSDKYRMPFTEIGRDFSNLGISWDMDTEKHVFNKFKTACIKYGELFKELWDVFKSNPLKNATLVGGISMQIRYRFSDLRFAIGKYLRRVPVINYEKWFSHLNFMLDLLCITPSLDGVFSPRKTIESCFSIASKLMEYGVYLLTPGDISDMQNEGKSTEEIMEYYISRKDQYPLVWN